jgi:serine phosphatase RsbU (regulator of sigma subunit)/ligand-binding sensor domain-containing protein
MSAKSYFYISLFLLLLIIGKSFGQNGTPFITHFKEIKEIETQNWSICQDSDNNMLFANRRGIIVFDGSQWDIIRLPYIPFVIRKNPKNNIVYVGTNNNYGYLEKDKKGVYQYISLSKDTAEIGVITKIIFTDSTMFFYSENSITRYQLENQEKFTRWYSKNEKPFTGLFFTPKNTFINVYDEGLYRLESDTLFPIVTGYLTQQNEILFKLPYDNDRVLVGTDESKLLLFDGIKYYDYPINDDSYLRESVLSEGIMISDSLYAFATLIGGVEIVNKKTGKIVYTINYQNGLPDDEVYSFALDNNNGLWVTHEYGVSRIDLKLSLQNFSTYPGLKGNLITTLIHNNELYIATSDGVFYLTEVKDYADIQVLVKTKPVEEKIRIVPDIQQDDNIKTEEKKSSKKLFSRLFGKKDKTEEKPIEQTEAKTVETPTSTTKIIQTQPRYVKKTVSTLKSINYIFKKVDGLNEKTKQLVSTERGILAATNSGLFQISNYRAEPIVKNTYINQISSKTQNNQHLVATNKGVFSVILKDGKWTTLYNFIDFNEPIYSIALTDDYHLWLGGDDAVYSFLLDSRTQPKALKTYKIKTPFPERYFLQNVNNQIVLFLESGLYYHNIASDTFMPYEQELWKDASRIQFMHIQHNLPWIKQNNEWKCLAVEKPWKEDDQKYLKMFSDITSIYADPKSNLWVVAENNQLFKISQTKEEVNPEFEIYFKKITNEEGMSFELSDLVFDASNNAIYFNIVAPYYVKQNSTQYQYFVNGLMNDWSKWSTNTNINLIVKPGDYSIRVRAKDVWGNISAEKSLEFKLKAPFTQSIWFYLLIAISVLVAFYFISKVRERKLQHDKQVLEQKVKERTIEIQEQKEEIEAQRDELAKSNDEISRQKEEITDSITYASRIQRAMLPLRDHFNKTFADHFIFYRPRDIVSGDFYWIAENNDKVYFAAADCTGHGVPGAFMSMLGISALNEIIRHTTNNLNANLVLNLLREKIKFSLHQTGKEGETKDGMDIALCILDKNKMKLEYSGAYNPLYLIRKGTLEEYKADRMPIGIYHVEKESFTNYEIKIEKGDTIYIFSDGYVDQFGGPTVTKFKSNSMKKLLIEIVDKPMIEQGQIMEKTFDQWKGQEYQVDDILVIGIRF